VQIADTLYQINFEKDIYYQILPATTDSGRKLFEISGFSD
jgi:hypothetical protein